HTLTAREPFVTPRMFTDRNFVSSLVLIFIVGVILYATLALLPPLLQGLMGYPVITTGEVLMPRGVGTMLAMLAVGRMSGRVDARLMLLVGLSLMTVSLWQMTHYSLEMDWRPVVWVGVVQGVGMGLVFVPLSTVAFATLPASHRTEAASMFSLIRNIGGSIVISMVVSRLSENTQLVHEQLAAAVTPYNRALRLPAVQRIWDIHTTAGLTARNDEVTRQAAMIAYLDDFKLMMLITAGAIPLLLLLHKPKRRRVQPREEAPAA